MNHVPELKPCPFCNGQAELIARPYEHLYYIQCTKCLATMGSQHRSFNTLHGDLFFDDEEKAIRMWNKRIKQGE